MTKAAFDLVILCLRMFQATAAVYFNLLTLICIAKYQSLRNATGMLVASLALSDTLHGLVMYTLPLRSYGIGPCIISQIAEGFTFNVQLLSFCMIAMERRNSLLAQLNATKKWPVRKVGVAMVAGWLLIAIGNVIAMVVIATGSDTHNSANEESCMARNQLPTIIVAVNIGFFCLTVSIIAIGYASISHIVIKSHYQVISHQPITVRQRERRKADLRVTKMMALVLGFFFALYIPACISVILTTDSSPFWQYMLYHITLNIYDMNCWINPIIYAWRNKQFRQAYSSLFSRCKPCCATDSNPVVHGSPNSALISIQATGAPSIALVPRCDIIPLPQFLQQSNQLPLTGTTREGLPVAEASGERPQTSTTPIANQEFDFGKSYLPRVD